MENNRFERTEILLGEEGIRKLSRARVAVFGIGGVGGHVVEALARSGVGIFDLIDNDIVALSNINRQIVAVTSTVGRYKVDVMKERILDINPEAKVYVHKMFFLPESADQFDFSLYSYVVDAIDTVAGKIQLVLETEKADVPIISAMGAGNKLDPTRFEVTDIYQTSVCPLAKVMRKELKSRGIKKLKVVYSKETPQKPLKQLEIPEGSARRQTPGSTAFVPSVAGLIISGEVIKDLTGFK
ncbi:tRNA threonylcarbamoyladenosine dehydratase [Anaerosacchariphilus polymeriproducens]|uniref:tRNA threonylcarbamoyladenosine dehydratase n=1 Tax=Anaerosacchariphilus polymeriproducens TaxID=1812858 RepID=A0A371AV66_9FIRM|nr:tRNA threonylcarbamoyladenosine dehydratase [Anaerosacchariphilus polymeriproducens]RDU23441.1 tRNA threonylcarbamoyladenosine dehydratase [Anaerosacchariphilus polymeriproducens]